MDLKDLYRDVIVDHNRNPRNFGKLEPADAHADGHNPLCGDRLTMYVDLDGDRDSRREVRRQRLRDLRRFRVAPDRGGEGQVAARTSSALFEDVHALLTTA